jgi:inosine-uridine nucleoside N-ribohydrolase
VLTVTQRVAAIVVTEGLSDPVEGAGAVEALLARLGRSVPVIVGASPPADRKYIASAQLSQWRENAERLNGLLLAPEKPAPGSVEGPADITAALKHEVTDCTRITLLVIGPWTSFMRYAPELLDRIDRIVAQGRPDPDEIGGTPSGFNCIYDVNNCLAAFDLLVGRRQRANRYLRATWVDIPNDPTSCGSAEPGIDRDGRPLYAFRPTEQWAATLNAGGGAARVIGEMLQKNPLGWEQTSLWDDLTALYILRPELFMIRGGHREPCVPSATVRRILADFLAKKPPSAAD